MVAMDRSISDWPTMRQKLRPLNVDSKPRIVGGSEPTELDQVVAMCREIFGAIEMDIATQPALDTGEDFMIVITGTDGKRPSMSLREAGKLATYQQTWRGYLAKLNKRAADIGQKQVVSVPKWHSVLVCPTCHELQLGSSRATRKTHECHICAARCAKSHRANQLNCSECIRHMRIIWTSRDEIPKEWLI